MYKLSSYKLMMVKDSSVRIPDKIIKGDQDAYKILQVYLQDADREHLVVLLLNTKYKVIGIHTVGIGTLDKAITSGREVFKAAILGNAAAIILGHNHPSGVSTPSNEDVKLTTMLYDAGKLLGIEVLDHVIIGEGEHSSMKKGHPYIWGLIG